VRKMLDFNPDTRISAQDALEHPWIRGEVNALATLNNDAANETLRSIQGMIGNARNLFLNGRPGFDFGEAANALGEIFQDTAHRKGQSLPTSPLSDAYVKLGRRSARNSHPDGGNLINQPSENTSFDDSESDASRSALFREGGIYLSRDSGTTDGSKSFQRSKGGDRRSSSNNSDYKKPVKNKRGKMNSRLKAFEVEDRPQTGDWA